MMHRQKSQTVVRNGGYRKTSQYQQLVQRGLIFLSILNQKPIYIHTFLLGIILSYALLGGVILSSLEKYGSTLQNTKPDTALETCIAKVLSEDSLQLVGSDVGERLIDQQAQRIARDCVSTVTTGSNREAMNFRSASLYTIGIMTTIGAGSAAAHPVTVCGQLFCVAFGLLGIPLSMVVLANCGRQIVELYASVRRRLRHVCRGVDDLARRVSERLDVTEASRADNNNRGTPESQGGSDVTEVTITLAAILFCFFLFSGTVFLSVFGRNNVVRGFYSTFLCLTALDFGGLAPANVVYLPLMLAYVVSGIGVTTFLCLEIGSTYLSRLHNLGKKLQNAKNVKIWFGAKTLTVINLVRAVGIKCDIPEDTIDQLDLDQMVEDAIAEQDGYLEEDVNFVDDNMASDNDMECGNSHVITDELPPEEPEPPNPVLFSSCPSTRDHLQRSMAPQQELMQEPLSPVSFPPARAHLQSNTPPESPGKADKERGSDDEQTALLEAPSGSGFSLGHQPPSADVPPSQPSLIPIEHETLVVEATPSHVALAALSFEHKLPADDPPLPSEPTQRCVTPQSPALAALSFEHKLPADDPPLPSEPTQRCVTPQSPALAALSFEHKLPADDPPLPSEPTQRCVTPQSPALAALSFEHKLPADDPPLPSEPTQRCVTPQSPALAALSFEHKLPADDPPLPSEPTQRCVTPQSPALAALSFEHKLPADDPPLPSEPTQRCVTPQSPFGEDDEPEETHENDPDIDDGAADVSPPEDHGCSLASTGDWLTTSDAHSALVQKKPKSFKERYNDSSMLEVVSDDKSAPGRTLRRRDPRKLQKLYQDEWRKVPPRLLSLDNRSRERMAVETNKSTS